jgi:two-component system sensor histidine kinase QseC
MTARGPAQPPSLTRRLLLWTLGALTLVWASFVFWGYQTGVEEADELTDGHLAGVAALLLNLQMGDGVAPALVTRRADKPGLRAHDYQQSLSVAQWNAQGQLVSRIGNAPVPDFGTPEGFATLQLGPQATAWRSFTQWDVRHERKITVLIDLQERDDLADDIAGQMIEPGLWLLPVVALALGLAIRRGLAPLYGLSQDVARLDVTRAERLAPRNALREMAPVVDSINTLLDRQQAAIVRERRLANEVAHELRTPLSSIVLQARALRDGGLDAGAHTQALDRIGRDALHAGHVLTQLLALARAGQALSEAPEPVDLAQLARSVSAGHAQAAWERGCQIAVQAPESLVIAGNGVLLEMALRNLVENALKHTPPGTRIEVQAGRGRGAWLQVCDDGRRGGTQPPAAPVDSLHLGHEIVARVAQMLGGHFGQPPAPAPFTTCYRLEFAPEAEKAAG